MKAIKTNKLTKFFKIVTENDLSSKAKMETYITDIQAKAIKIGVNNDESLALRLEAELIFDCHNYLSDIVRDNAVKSLLKEYLKK